MDFHWSQPMEKVQETGLDPITFMLFRIAECGFTAEAEDVIKKGANVNGFNIITRKTPLTVASEKGDTDMARLLIKYGANINGNYPYLSPLTSAACNGHVRTVAMLIENGANINKRELNETSVLNIASEKGYNDIVKMLLKHGAKVTDELRESSLMCAARNGHLDVAETLIDGGANINYENLNGYNVLELSLMFGLQHFAKLLIEKGAKLDGAFKQALRNNCTEVVNILINKDVKHKDKYGNTMLMVAASLGKLELMTELIEKGSDIDETDKSGRTPLILATAHGFVKAVDLLIEKGANVNRKQSIDGATALMIATEMRCKDVVKKLIEHGACVNERNNKGWTALMCACQFSHEEPLDIETLLIDNNSDLNVQATNGETALILATIFRSKQMVELLIDKGADVHIQMKTGMSARLIAMSISNEEILNVFINKRSMMSTNSVKELKSFNEPMNTDSTSAGQCTMSHGQHTMSPALNTVPTGQGTMAQGQDTTPPGPDTMSTGQDIMSTGQDPMPTRQGTAPSGQVTMHIEHDTVPTGQDKTPPGQDTMPLARNTMPHGQVIPHTGQDTKPHEEDTMPPGQDTIHPGQDTNVSQDEISMKQSVEFDDDIILCLSFDIQQQTELEDNKKALKEETIENLESTDALPEEQEGESHFNHPIEYKERKRTKRKRCQSLNKKVPRTKVVISHGEEVSSTEVASIQVKVKNSTSRGDDERLVAESQALFVQNAGSCEDIYDPITTVNTAKSSEDVAGTESFNITGTISTVNTEQISPDNINIAFSDSFQIQLKPNEMVLKESRGIANANLKRSRDFTNDDNAASVQKDDEWPNCSSNDVDKIIMQLREICRAYKLETDRAGQLQDTTNEYYNKQQSPIVFQFVHIDRVDQAHIKNPLCVNITDTTYCVID